MSTHVELSNSLSSVIVGMTTSLQHNTGHGLRNLSSQEREELLGSPQTLLIASHSGTPFDYAHQCSAAEGVVPTDRSRQLMEQAESNHRPFTIEFPVRALCAALSAFRDCYEASADVADISFDVGNILPGYAMCVLDWLVRALTSKHWIDFLPQEAQVCDEDKWYWVYCYSAMRSLGMDGFAHPLRDFIMRLINTKTLILDCENYVHLLRVMPPSDALFTYLAERTAWQMSRQTLPLSAMDVEYIAARFPDFAALVNKFGNC